MKNSYKSGLLAEWISRQFLRLHGYKILESRHITGRLTGRAEIDIIAKRGRTIVFIEVKNRPDYVTGYFAVTAAQKLRLRRAAENFLVRKKWTGSSRFDIMVVSGWRIRWLKNIQI
ncbi:MAG: YraN family protein [Rickettsiales bacterium]|jgi:putative endonuclease|nr:YraN family protein [Rickettsiales bacterium]